MSKELKPCPFCGGDASLIGHSTMAYRFVRCDECGASTIEFESMEFNAQEVYDNGDLKAWNGRYDEHGWECWRNS